MKPVLLLTDLFVFALFAAGILYIRHVRRTPQLLANWRLAVQRPAAGASAVMLGLFLLLALADSLHFRQAGPMDPSTGARTWSVETRSALDIVLAPIAARQERSYSRPLAWLGFRKETFDRDGRVVRDFPRLKFGGAHLSDPPSQWAGDVARRAAAGVAGAALAWMLAALSIVALLARRASERLGAAIARTARGRTRYPVRAMLLTACALMLAIGALTSLSTGYHVFGTDRVGASVLVAAVKSIRTALVIGALTTLVVLPLAVALGVTAGYFRGWIDEAIQYVYTLLASIPDVLLIAAAVLLLQVKIDANPALFETALERADARLFFLCLILGITSFTGLCRLVRGETMKLRELEYIQAAHAFGVRSARVLVRHILPNVAPIVLISTVMQFSGFVLAEAVLSYVGVGVDPQTASFGVMINTARLELAATPVIWWTLATAFVFMFLIVLSANVFADMVRDAFDPRARLRS
ncbi:MAG: ABC transporter permease [Betaproteobacteria bacterium]|nr:ABC transporter permease [Betaproteobacteria bacterium]